MVAGSCVLSDQIDACTVIHSKCIKAESRTNEHLIITVMGLLSLGTPLHWDQAKHYADHVRYHGVTQFLNIWDNLKDRQGDELLWGDEVLRHHATKSLHPLISPLTSGRVYDRTARR